MRRQFEFAIVVMVVAVLALVVMQALERVRTQMEEAGVQTEAAAIRAQLMEVVAHREVFGGQLPASENPLDWVRGQPANYIGAVDRVPTQESVWYYDSVSKELVYRFRNGELARFRLSRMAGDSGVRGVIGGVGLLRLDNP